MTTSTMADKNMRPVWTVEGAAMFLELVHKTNLNDILSTR